MQSNQIHSLSKPFYKAADLKMIHQICNTGINWKLLRNTILRLPDRPSKLETTGVGPESVFEKPSR